MAGARRLAEKVGAIKASAICEAAAAIVAGARQAAYGSKRRNHHNIAALWNAYLATREHPSFPLGPRDVALMMALLKIARTQLGRHTPDNYVDLAGYGAVAGEIAADEAVATAGE